MNKLEQLPEISSQVLSGLKADESLKHRILLAAASDTGRRSFSRRSLWALCCLSAAMIAACILISPFSSSNHSIDPGLHEIAAGTYHSSSPVHLQQLLSREKDFQDDILSESEGDAVEEQNLPEKELSESQVPED